MGGGAAGAGAGDALYNPQPRPKPKPKHLPHISQVQEMLGEARAELEARSWEIYGRYTGDIRELCGRYTGDIREIYGRS